MTPYKSPAPPLALYVASAAAGLAACASLLALATLVFFPGKALARSEPEPALAAAQELVALVETEAGAARLVRAAAGRGYRVIERHALRGLDLTLLNLTRPTTIAPDGAIAELEALEPQATVGVNHLYSLQGETAAPRVFSRAAIGWPAQGCRLAARLGVIDTGPARTAPTLAGTAIIEKSFLRQAERAAPEVHGAAIAHLLVGRPGAGETGLLPQAELYHATVVERRADGSDLARVDRMTRAIDWMAASGVKVVNISLAGPRNKILARAIERAAEKGLILVAAAGNAGPSAAPLHPAAMGPVIAVTAVDADLRVYAKANRGPHIAVAAPGVDLWLPRPSGVGRYVSGTSLAAPFVAARLAAAAARGEIDDVAGARALLAAESRDLGASGPDEVYGHGLIAAPAEC